MGYTDTVIFDLDGTLLDTLDDLTNCINHTMNLFGYPKRTSEEVRSFVGNGIGMLVKRAVPKYVTDAQYEIVLAEFKNYYTKHCNKTTKPYEGIPDMLRCLKEKGIKMAIVSNKNQKAVTELKKIFFEGLIDIAVGDADGINKKPSPEGVFRALKELGSDVENAVYVGDSDVDVETVKNAGIRGLFVTWGFRDREKLVEAGATEFIDSPSEIVSLL